MRDKIGGLGEDRFPVMNQQMDEGENYMEVSKSIGNLAW